MISRTFDRNSVQINTCTNCWKLETEHEWRCVKCGSSCGRGGNLPTSCWQCRKSTSATLYCPDPITVRTPRN